jgi:DNA-binding response OmpR family regulator
MVSAKTSKLDIKLSLDMGANDYITKPIDFSTAFTLVQKHLTNTPLDPERDQSALPLATFPPVAPCSNDLNVD